MAMTPNRIALFGALALPALVTAIPVAAQETVPVTIGRAAEMDACMTFARVFPLDPAGPAYVAVRSGPSKEHPETGKLHAGDAVWFCDGRGNYIGVVYPTAEDMDCGVTSPVPTARPYDGPCASGWIDDEGLVGPVAG